jgi:hypothetical protein
LNSTRAGGILGLPSDFNANFNLAISYTMPDARTNVVEHKSVSLTRENRKDGIIDIEMKWASENAIINHKMELSHPDFLVIKRLIDVGLL